METMGSLLHGVTHGSTGTRGSRLGGNPRLTAVPREPQTLCSTGNRDSRLGGNPRLTAVPREPQTLCSTGNRDSRLGGNPRLTAVPREPQTLCSTGNRDSRLRGNPRLSAPREPTRHLSATRITGLDPPCFPHGSAAICQTHCVYEIVTLRRSADCAAVSSAPLGVTARCVTARHGTAASRRRHSELVTATRHRQVSRPDVITTRDARRSSVGNGAPVLV